MDLRESIVKVTHEVFSQMLYMEATPQEPIEPGMTFFDSISGIIGFGGTVKGMLAVHVSEGVAKTITGGFLDMPVDEIDNEVNDAIGELANMLAGSVKHTLSKNLVGIRLSLPSVIMGNQYSVGAPTHGFGIIVPFHIPGGIFYVEFHFVESNS